jgi:hypothetical protein
MIEALWWCGLYLGLYCIGQEIGEWWLRRRNKAD